MNLSLQKSKMVIKEFFHCQYWIFIRLLVQQLPFGFSYKLASYLSYVGWIVLRSDRRAIRRGITHIYQNRLTSRQVNRITLKTIDHMLKTTVDKFYYPLMTRDFCCRHVKVEGLHFLDEALDKRKGVVLLHSHLGNPHWIMPAIGHLGYPLHQVASRTTPEKQSGLMGDCIYSMQSYVYKKDLAYKETFPVNFIYIDGFLRKIFRVVAKNEILAVGIDGREGQDSVQIDFLNDKATFYTGMMRFFLRTQPVILPTFHIRNSDHSQTIIIEKPVPLVCSGDLDYDVFTNMVGFVKKLESYIFQYPWLYADAFARPDPYFQFNQKNGL